jgi:hypothetical protein
MRAMCTLPAPPEPYGSILHHVRAASTVWETPVCSLRPMSSSKNPPPPRPPAAPNPSLSPSEPSSSPQRPAFALGSALPARPRTKRGQKHKAPTHNPLTAQINPKTLYRQGFLQTKGPGASPSYSPNNRPKKQASKAPERAVTAGHSPPPPWSPTLQRRRSLSVVGRRHAPRAPPVSRITKLPPVCHRQYRRHRQ